jgi:hypothetical protein
MSQSGLYVIEGLASMLGTLEKIQIASASRDVVLESQIQFCDVGRCRDRQIAPAATRLRELKHHRNLPGETIVPARRSMLTVSVTLLGFRLSENRRRYRHYCIGHDNHHSGRGLRHHHRRADRLALQQFRGGCT